MFQYHENKLCIEAGGLYNKPLYDDIIALERELKTADDSMGLGH